MSFVLDALKGSEQKRSRFSRRTCAHPPRPRRPGRERKWLAPLGAALALATVVLGWRLVTPAPGTLSSPAPEANDAGASPSPNAATAGTPGTYPAEAPAAGNKLVLDAPEPTEAGGGTAPERESSDQQTRPLSFRPSDLERQSDPEPAPARRLLAAAPSDWPALSLQMIFFSEEDERRFVQVNGRTYRQGERLAAGPEVRRIGKDGVTLAYRGQQILLGVER